MALNTYQGYRAMPQDNLELESNIDVDQVLIDLSSLNDRNVVDSLAWRTLQLLPLYGLKTDDLEKIVRFLTLKNSLPEWDLGKVLYRIFDTLAKRKYVNYVDLLRWVLVNKGANIFRAFHHESMGEEFCRGLIAAGFENIDSFRLTRFEEWHSKVWGVDTFRNNTHRGAHERIPNLLYRRLVASALVDDELLIEALLLRGFLAYRDGAGVWLGTGSHEDDLIVLQWVHGLNIRPISGSSERLANIRFSWGHRHAQLSSVAGILSIPQNTTFCAESVYDYRMRVNRDWSGYRETVWGTKLSVCPSTNLRSGRWLGYDALDAGIALLVKAWPLARVSTACHSCDGHGQSPAGVGLATTWDRKWGEAVFKTLAVPTPYSVWFERGDCSIRPISDQYEDESVLGLLDDIQRFARRLLDMTVIEKIGHARAATLATFESQEPPIEEFAAEAAIQLLKQGF